MNKVKDRGRRRPVVWARDWHLQHLVTGRRRHAAAGPRVGPAPEAPGAARSQGPSGPNSFPISRSPKAPRQDKNLLCAATAEMWTERDFRPFAAIDPAGNDPKTSKMKIPWPAACTASLVALATPDCLHEGVGRAER